MKKWIAGLVSIMCFMTVAIAEQRVTADGQIEVKNTVEIVAPFSGVVLPFEGEVGDQISRGDVLMQLDMQKIYAPYDGTLGIVFAKEGEQAADVLNRYGALALIEPTQSFLLQSTTEGAYDEPENKRIHVGETLYFKNSGDSRIKGEGRVISVKGEGYQVEVTQGTLEMQEEVDLYRDSLYMEESQVGSGVCEVVEPVKVLGEGRVVACYAQKGDKVKAGDLLFETVSADALPNAQSEIVSEVDGVLSALYVVNGQNVYKGQWIASIADKSQLQVSCMVDEVDLYRVKMGASLEIVLDAYPNETYYGIVNEISQQGILIQNATHYEVIVSLQGAEQLKQGMNATVYLP